MTHGRTLLAIVVLGLVAPASARETVLTGPNDVAGLVGQRSCWKRTTLGFSFSDRHAGNGPQRLVLRTGSTGRTRFDAIGAKGSALVPVLSAPDGLRLELRGLDDRGICWATDIGTVKRNTRRRYRGVGG